MKRIVGLMAALLAGCAAKVPPPLAVPPHALMRHAPRSAARNAIEADADAARRAADHYIFSARSTSEGIETVRALSRHMRAAVARMRVHGTAGNVAETEAAVTAVRTWLAEHP